MPDSLKPAPASGAPTLVPQGEQAGKPALPLNRPFTLVGSRSRAHLHLLSTTISRNHACVIKSGDGSVYVRDMASRSGVIVNGRRIKEVELHDGDSLQIGSFKFKLTEPPSSFHPHEGTTPPAVLEMDGTTITAIDGRTVLIGRRPNCDVPLDAASVSNTHAIIFEIDAGRAVRDLGSRTGTIVNGNPVHQQILEFGDEIRIGDTSFKYLSAEAAGATDEPQSLAALAELVPDEAEAEPAGEPEPARIDHGRIPLHFDDDQPAAQAPTPNPARTPAPVVARPKEPLPIDEAPEEPLAMPEASHEAVEAPLEPTEVEEEPIPLDFAEAPEPGHFEPEVEPVAPSHGLTAAEDVLAHTEPESIDFAADEAEEQPGSELPQSAAIPAPPVAPVAEDEPLDFAEDHSAPVAAEPETAVPEAEAAPALGEESHDFAAPAELPAEPEDSAPVEQTVTAPVDVLPEPQPPQAETMPPVPSWHAEPEAAAEADEFLPVEPEAEPAAEALEPAPASEAISLETPHEDHETPATIEPSPEASDDAPAMVEEPLLRQAPPESHEPEAPAAPLRVEDMDLSTVSFAPEQSADVAAETAETSPAEPVPLLDLVPPPPAIELTAPADVLATEAVTDIELPATDKTKRKQRTPRKKPSAPTTARRGTRKRRDGEESNETSAEPLSSEAITPFPTIAESEVSSAPEAAIPFEPEVTANATEIEAPPEVMTPLVEEPLVAEAELPAIEPEPAAAEPEPPAMAESLADLAEDRVLDEPAEAAPMEPETLVPVEAPLPAASVEIVERTEPTPESAFNLADELTPPGMSEDDLVVSSSDTDLSDTAFGRAVQDFSGGESGALVEEVAPVTSIPATSIAAEEPVVAQATDLHESIEPSLQHTGDAEDADFFAAIDSELASSELSVPAETPTEFQTDGGLDFSTDSETVSEAETRPPHSLTASGALDELAASVDSTDALSDDFSLTVAEAIESSLHLEAEPMPELASATTDSFDSMTEPGELQFDEPAEVSVEPPIDFEAAPAAEAIEEPVALTPMTPEPPPVAAPALAEEPGLKPSLDPYFGMTRDLGSFIGGMPLALAPGAPSAADLRMPAPARAPAASAVAEADENLFEPDEPLELFDETAETLDALPDSLDEIGDVAHALADARPAPATPVARPGAGLSSLRSLTADPFISSIKAQPAATPSVPPFVGGRNATRRTTSSFQGLAAPPVRATDVFSNTAFPASTAAMFRSQPVDDIPPITARHSELKSPAIPPAAVGPATPKATRKENSQSQPPASSNVTTPGREQKKPDAGSPSEDEKQKRKPWWKKLLVLLPLMLGMMIAAAVTIMLLFPPRRFVQGTLQLSALDNQQNVMARKEQVRGLRDSLRKPDLKNVVTGNLQVQNVPSGFIQGSLDGLADPENSPFDEKRGALILRRQTGDPAGDSKRMAALLLAVYKENQTPAEDAAAARKSLSTARNERNRLEQELAIANNTVARSSEQVKLAAPPDIESLMAEPADAITALEMKDVELRKNLQATGAGGNADDTQKAYAANQDLLKSVHELKDAQDRSAGLAKSLKQAQADVESLTARANSAAVLQEPDEASTQIVNEQDQRFWYVLIALGAIVAVFAVPLLLAARDSHAHPPLARVMTQGYSVQGRDADEYSIAHALDADEQPAIG
jgi:pSer/pThr/pTyr-binding forkhead associated (FHA) protein